ncbi:PorP/SprF family type IX secretion system membrane protein [Winogradskyella sediminis]|uniref:PorP/SprF family type IX secretion system membrane protein n=1 Tax=Winogradskyella sediminis TaxID=1382466 RepID=UPI000E24140E|nr:PorP/SprF family type IX secretion system membrane protein [Winogradskyella sediminis]REG86234.1 type IX secretion system PorP/SprF family membrane protein [Winogradskyella sediminis]
MKGLFLLLILCFCSVQTFYAQEDDGVVSLAIPTRNSLTFNRYTINPTFSFVREQTKYISFYNKREWVQFENAPLTYLASYSGRFGENIGAGLGLFQQNYGVLTTFGGILNFAYNATLGYDSNLTFGLNIGAYKSGINTGNVVTNFNDPSLQNVPENFLITINPGINYGTEFLDFGVSINNLALYNLESSALIEDNPQQSVQAHVMYTGYMSSRGFFDESKFTGLLRSEFQKEETIISGVAMVTVPKGIWGQVGYNTLYGVSGGIGLNITTQIAIEYNYETAFGDLSNYGPSHEISLAYRFKNNNYYDYSRADEVTGILSTNKNRRRRVTKTPKSTVASRKSVIDAKAKADAEAQRKVEQEELVLQQQQEAEAKRIEAQKTKALAEAKAKAEKEEAERIAAQRAEMRAKIQAEQKAQEEAAAQAKLLAEQKAKEEAAAQAKLLAEQKAKEEAAAQAKLLAEQKAKEEAAAQAKLLAEQKAQEEAAAQAKLLAEQKAKEEAAAQAKLLAEQKAKEEAAAQAKLLAEQKAKEEAAAQAKLLAEQKAQEEAAAQAKLLTEQKAQEEAAAQAKLLAEQKAQEEAAAQAKLLAEQKAQEEAAAQAKLLAEQKAQEEAAAQAKLLAEQKAQEEAAAQAKLLAEQKAQEEAAAQAKLLAEQKAQEEKEANVDAIANPKDALAVSMQTISKATEASKAVQNELLKQFDDIVAIKDQDLKDMKEENDLSDQGIVVQPKPFKSVTAENNKLRAIKADLDAVIKTRSEKIEELKAIYEERAAIKELALDEVTLFYKKEINRLQSEQLKANEAKSKLDLKLEAIKVATEFEKRRRIKRAAFNNEDDRYSQDRARLKKLKETTALAETPYKAEDFDFGEAQGNSIKILKNISHVKSGFYLIIAVHSDVKSRDEFLRKVIASGRTNVDFFHDVNTSKYYIYYDKVDDISSANRALETKGNRPYNGKMTIVKIENQ